MATTILPTKLYIPQARPDLVPRERLLVRLNDGLFDSSGEHFARRLSLIAAPAGFGKTTLVIQWLAPVPVKAWLSLEEEDDDLFRFFNYLVATLRGFDGLGRSLPGLLATPQAVPAKSLASALVHDVTSVNIPFILVLDDYHLLASPAIVEAMTFIVDHLPPQMHLALTGRSLPDLPLSRLRARGQMLEIGQAELRFTPKEATAFMNDSMGLALNEGDVTALESRTEGWAAGLQLAAVALSTGATATRATGGTPSNRHADVQRFIASFSGDDQYVSDYLVEEVLSRQPADVLQFLGATAVTERICGPLADALTGDRDGQQRLAWLQERNLFIIPLDHRRRWFRYHHLLADFLRHRLAQDKPGWLIELHSRAGRWFAEQGFVDEAISHALAAGDLDRAALQVERVARDMLMRGEVSTLNRWLNTFPLAYLLDRPGLLTLEVFVEVITGSLGEKQIITDQVLHQGIQAAQKLPASYPDRDQLTGELIAHSAGVASLVLDFDRSLALSYQAMEYATGNDYLLGYIYLIIANNYRLNGQDFLALDAFTTGAGHGEKAGNGLLVVTSLTNMAELYEVTGQLGLAEITCRRALSLSTAEDGQILPSAGAAYLGLAKVQRERNQLAEAVLNLAEARGLAEVTQMAGLETDALITLALLLLGQGSWNSAYSALDQAEALTRQAGDPFTIRRIGAFRSRLQLLQGDLAAPRLWAQSTGLSIDDPVEDILEIDYLTLARILLAEGQPEDALTLMDRWQPVTESAGRRSRLIEYFILRGVAYQDMDQTEKAINFLAQALNAGQSEGFVRLFADEGTRVSRLLASALDASSEPDALELYDRVYARKILEIMLREARAEAARKSSPAIVKGELLDPLKERELQVLRLIAAGLSNREIAGELFLTEGTVKSYTHQIYSKLGVHRRTEAVEMGRELGLLG